MVYVRFVRSGAVCRGAGRKRAVVPCERDGEARRHGSGWSRMAVMRLRCSVPPCVG